MDPGQLIGSLIQDALFSRKKRRRGAAHFLTGGRNSFLNASTLLTAVGVVWGLVESSARPSVPPVPAPAGGTGAQTPPAPPPPIPAAAGARAESSQSPGMTDEVLRLVRLTISAARADGELSAEETERILSHAREAGAEKLVERELLNPQPLAEIVSGVSDPQVRADLYTLAFTIVRADEGVSGAERIYLAQLAHHLGLDPTARDRLEQEAAAKITEASS